MLFEDHILMKLLYEKYAKIISDKGGGGPLIRFTQFRNSYRNRWALSAGSTDYDHLLINTVEVNNSYRKRYF
jgi:hypothetical protein